MSEAWLIHAYPIMSTYLLDTSAFRALSAARLRAASRIARLVVSPFCFWDLLTHLEDDREFARVLARSGGRITDSMEREMMRKALESDWNLPQ